MMIVMVTRSFVFAFFLFFQSSTAPLEAVKVEGTVVPPAVVQEIAQLRLGQIIGKQGIEEGCARLNESGLFTSIQYRYMPGPKLGYVVTLQLVDQPADLAAAIDVPGVDEGAAWAWLKTRFPAFDRRIPQRGGVEDFIAAELTKQFKSKLEGQRVVPRREEDVRGRPSMVFQPDVLPQITEMKFSGNHEITSEELSGLMRKALGDAGFTERSFRQFLEGTARQAYEEHGMYRVNFQKVSIEKTAAQGVVVTTEIVEGPQFVLGEVKYLGDELPLEKMNGEGKFALGKVANWRDIQQGIYRVEKPVKRMGFLQATANPRKILNDEQKRMDLEIAIRKGPLFHFGQVKFEGFTPEAEAKGREMWKMQSGAPFDYAYVNEFLGEFGTKVRMGSGAFAVRMVAGAGEHVMDEIVTWKAK